MSNRAPLLVATTCLLLSPIQLAWSPLAVEGIPFRLQDMVVLISGIALLALPRPLDTADERPSDRWIDGLALATVVGIALSIALAINQSLAIVAGGRLIAGIILFVGIRRAALGAAAIMRITALVGTRRAALGAAAIMRITALVGTVAAVFALVNYSGVVAPDPTWFVGSVRRAGFFERLTLPFSHPNIAGTFLLSTAFLSAWFLADAWRQQRQIPTVVLSLGLLAQTAAFWLTASRAILGIAVGAAAVIALARGARRQMWPLALSVILVGAIVGLTSDLLRFRFLPSFRDDITQVSVAAPASLTLDGRLEGVDVTITNDTNRSLPLSTDERFQVVATWSSGPGEPEFRQSWPIETILDPGDSSTITIDDAVGVAPGSYSITWDVEYANRPFSDWAGGSATTSAEVVASSGPELSAAREARVGRRSDTWRIAWSMFIARPATGVGPGNLPAAWSSYSDETAVASHAHQFVLEPLATIGLFGSIPFFGLIAAAIAAGLRGGGARRATTGALLVIIAAGAVDWSLSATSANTLFWALLAVTATTRHDEDQEQTMVAGRSAASSFQASQLSASR